MERSRRCGATESPAYHRAPDEADGWMSAGLDSSGKSGGCAARSPRAESKVQICPELARGDFRGIAFCQLCRHDPFGRASGLAGLSSGGPAQKARDR